MVRRNLLKALLGLLAPVQHPRRYGRIAWLKKDTNPSERVECQILLSLS